MITEYFSATFMNGKVRSFPYHVHLLQFYHMHLQARYDNIYDLLQLTTHIMKNKTQKKKQRNDINRYTEKTNTNNLYKSKNCLILSKHIPSEAIHEA